MTEGSFRFPFSLRFAKIATSSWFSQGSARPGNIDVVRVILGENFFYIACVLVLCQFFNGSQSVAVVEINR